MKILIDIGHPAHVHYYRNFIKIMESKGHKFFVLARDKDVAQSLLGYYGIDYASRGKGGHSLVGKILYIPKADYKLYKYARQFKPDIFLSSCSSYAAHVSKLLGKPHIVFDDTQEANFEHLMYVPFTEAILTPKCFTKKLGAKQIYFDGYMELCYLSNGYFQPDFRIKEELGLGPSDNYVVLRFVSWQATHDIGHKGISLENKIRAVQEFEKYAKVFISSEVELPEDLKKYRLKIDPHKMHDALAFSSLLFSESSTMASECAVLGTPSIYLDNNSRCYTQDEEKRYGLVYNYSESLTDQDKAIEKGVELLTMPELKNKWRKRRLKMLSEKIDVTAFMVWFIENYPSSFNLMKRYPEKTEEQFRFNNFLSFENNLNYNT